MLRPTVHAAVMTALLFAAACQGPPPVGRAADPTPQMQPGKGDAESQDLLRKVDKLQAQLKDQPKSRPLRMALGKLYYENERFLDAAAMLRQSLDEQPDDAEALKLLGNCFFFLGNPDDAIKMHEGALKVNPTDIDALFFLGAILVESRPQDREALKRAGDAWAKFLELAPKHPRRKEIEEQLEVVRKAERGEIVLGATEKKDQPHGSKGGSDEEEVTADGEQGAMGGQRSFGGGAPAGGGGPGPQFKKGTRVPALKEDAKPLERKRAEALDALDEGRFFDARTAAEVVLQTQPGDDEMAVARARSMVQLGEAEQAIRAFGEIIKRNQRYAPAWHYLGMAHMMAGDAKRAAQTWRDLIAMDPEYAAKNRLEMRAQMAERMARSQQ